MGDDADTTNALPNRAFRSDGEDQALAEYENLAAQVTTTGQVWRSAIDHLVDAEVDALARPDSI